MATAVYSYVPSSYFPSAPSNFHEDLVEKFSQGVSQALETAIHDVVSNPDFSIHPAYRDDASAFFSQVNDAVQKGTSVVEATKSFDPRFDKARATLAAYQHELEQLHSAANPAERSVMESILGAKTAAASDAMTANVNQWKLAGKRAAEGAKQGPVPTNTAQYRSGAPSTKGRSRGWWKTIRSTMSNAAGYLGKAATGARQGTSSNGQSPLTAASGMQVPQSAHTGPVITLYLVPSGAPQPHKTPFEQKRHEMRTTMHRNAVGPRRIMRSYVPSQGTQQSGTGRQPGGETYIVMPQAALQSLVEQAFMTGASQSGAVPRASTMAPSSMPQRRPALWGGFGTNAQSSRIIQI